MQKYILTPLAAEHRLFEQYPGQTKLLYVVHTSQTLSMDPKICYWLKTTLICRRKH